MAFHRELADDFTDFLYASIPINTLIELLQRTQRDHPNTIITVSKLTGTLRVHEPDTDGLPGYIVEVVHIAAEMLQSDYKEDEDEDEV